MSISLIKCKICQKVISEPEIIIGEPSEIRIAKTMMKLMNHIQKRIVDETNDSTNLQKPHAAVWQQNAFSIFQYQMLLTSYLFELTPELIADQEKHRAGFHTATAPQTETQPA